MRRAWRWLRARAVGRRGSSGWTVRLRLTVLYGALFLVSGGVLLGITYALVAQRLPSAASQVQVTVRSPGPLRQIVIGNGSGNVAGNSPNLFLRTGGASATVPAKGPLNGPPDPLALLAQLQSAAEAQRAASLRELLVGSAVALGAMVVVSSGLGWLMAGRALRPLRAMTGAAQNISEANLHERLPETGPRDELRRLAATFNALLARLESAFDSQRRFVANASHELRTPLTLERAILEVALADPGADAASLRAACQRALAIGAEQEGLIEALVTLARSQRGLDERHPVDLASTAAAAAAKCDAAGRSIALDVDPAPALLFGDQRLVERLVVNLLDNGVRHNYPGGWLQLQTSTRGGRAVLRVSNTGPQVRDVEVPDLMQPFQRAGADRTRHADGWGLGLSIVSAIAAAHDAQLHVEPRPAGGLDVVVVFPLTGPHPPSPPLDGISDRQASMADRS